MKTTIKLIILITAGLVLLSLTGCSPKVSDDLTGGVWTLVSYDRAGAEQQAVKGATTLTFGENGSTHGNAGCNSNGGRYIINGKELSFEEITRTLMACADEDRMRQESEYFWALQNAGVYEIAGGKFIIQTSDPDGRLTFEKAGQID